MEQSGTSQKMFVTPSDVMESNKSEDTCEGIQHLTLQQSLKSSSSFCNITWDGASCWPETLSNQTAAVSCPTGLSGIDHTQNVTRFCFANGTWASKSYYGACFTEQQVSEYFRVVSFIFHFGFGVSTVALAIALGIFCYFRNLRCLRNSIHCNLILTFILRNVFWFAMMQTIQDYSLVKKHYWVCEVVVISFHYFQTTIFFWMFVEGLYLHVILVWTYSADKLRLRHFLLIGWGLPIPFLIVWAVLKMRTDEEKRCLSGESPLDYIQHVPIFIILFANIIFFVSVVWILITKLRMTFTPEARDYRKAVKAAIVLLPLLGITYVIFILHDTTVSGIIFKYADYVLQSFQGFLVAVFYCFLNGEVRQSLRSKLRSSKNNNSRYTATRCSRVSSMSLHKQPMTVSFAMQQELLADQKLNGTSDFTSMSDCGNERLTVIEDEVSNSSSDTKV